MVAGAMLVEDRCGSSGRRFLLLGQLQKNRIMEIWTILLAAVQQLQMPRPDLAVVTIYLPRDEAPFPCRFRELLEGGGSPRRHHQGETVVRQPTVDRFHQVRTGLVEEQAVRAQDHVVRFFHEFLRVVAAASPALCKNEIEILGGAEAAGGQRRAKGIGRESSAGRWLLTRRARARKREKFKRPVRGKVVRGGTWRGSENIKSP